MIAFQPVCPLCNGEHRQTRAGLAVNGNQRYQCQDCKRYYVQENRRYRYPVELRRKAMEMHASGSGCRQIARELYVNHQTISNWLNNSCSVPRSPSIWGDV